MSSPVAIVKTLFVPAVISLLLFGATSYVLIPFWRRYRARYAQYLPLPLDASLGAIPLTDRLRRAITLAWLRRRFRSRPTSDADSQVGGEDLQSPVFDDELLSNAGEELCEFIPDWELARAAAVTHEPELAPRLSRDLEEGFRDDSEDEADSRPRSP